MNGKQLRKARVAAGLTQPALARLAGLSVRTLSGYETGTRPIPHRNELLLTAVLTEVAK